MRIGGGGGGGALGLVFQEEEEEEEGAFVTHASFLSHLSLLCVRICSNSGVHGKKLVLVQYLFTLVPLSKRQSIHQPFTNHPPSIQVSCTEAALTSADVEFSRRAFGTIGSSEVELYCMQFATTRTTHTVRYCAHLL